MLEIEVKAQCDDPAKVKMLLYEMGANFERVITQKDVYFAHPAREFSQTDEALRLRDEGGNWTLHYKGPKVDKDTKTREELGLSINDYDTICLILDRLGFKKAAVVEKTREVFRLEKVEIAIDDVVNLGTFVELEIQDENLEESKKCIFALMEKLDLRKTIRSSYLELLESESRLKSN